MKTAAAASSIAKKAAEQPFRYPLERAYAEPDWRRLPGYRSVSQAEWEDATWQRKNTVKNLRELKEALGGLLTDALAEDIERDIRERATMSMLITPHMINTMDERDLYADPLRRYMLPALSDRRTDWPSHPRASRDSLHEQEMWKVEGLTHRYPTKVLAEMLSTCPQYCGHCTRMDLVGNSVPQVKKLKFALQQRDRHQQMLDYLRATPQRARRGGLGRRHRQPSRRYAGAVRQRAARHAQHPRHPPRLEGADGHPPALPPGRGAAGARSAGEEGGRSAASRWRCTPT